MLLVLDFRIPFCFIIITTKWNFGIRDSRRIKRCDSTAGFVAKIHFTYLDGIGQSVNSLKHGIATVNTKFDFLTHVTKSTDVVALSRDAFEASL